MDAPPLRSPPLHPMRPRVEDIRTPLTLEEADAAIDLATGVLADIERTRVFADPARADTAASVWRHKLRELAYARAKLRAGESPEAGFGTGGRVRVLDLRRPVTAEEAAAALTLIEGRLEAVTLALPEATAQRRGDLTRALGEWTAARDAFVYALARLRAGEPLADPELEALREKLARVQREIVRNSTALHHARKANGRMAALLERAGIDHGREPREGG